MRRFLITSFFSLALLVGVSGGIVPVAHAITCPEGQVEGTEDLAGLCFPKAATSKSIAGGTADYGTTPAATASTAQNAGGGTPTAPKGNSDDAYNIVMQKIMELFAWLVGVAALTLDTAVFYTVVKMGEYINNLSAIGVAWRILRDVGNIMLIFGFLAIGITTILNVEWYGGGKKMLPMLFIGAIFLNFSLFITEAVIDTGNLFATQFYKQINGGNLPTAAMTKSATVQDEGISNKLMAQLGLQTLYNVNSGKVKKEVFAGTSPWLIGFMGILLFIVTAFVMFSLAFVLIARFVMLIFLIILAPVGFAGLAIPQLRARAKQWWDTLFEQTITAPVLLLMLYVALAVITDAQFLVGFNPSKGGLLDFVNNNNLAGFGGVILSFLVAMGLLLFVVVASKKLSAFGADWASQTAGKLSFGLTAAGLRGTAGWGLQRASTGWRKTALSRAPIIGRAVSGALDRGAKGSFDVRGVAVAGGLKGMNVDAGAAQKGGFRDWEKGKTKEREDYAKTLEQTTGKFMGLRYTKGEVDKQEDAEAEVRAAEANLRVAKSGNDEAAIKTAASALEHAQTEVKNIKMAPQAGYAKGLNLYIDKEKGGFLRGAVGVLNPLRNTKAAENILKEAKKSKAEKDFENFKKLIEEKAKEEKPKEEKKEEPKAEAAH